MGRRWAKLAVVATVALAICCGSAAVASAEGEPDTGAFNAFTVKASNGYRMLVLAGSRKGYRNGEVLILVGRKGRSVSYLAPATVTDTKVEADLGALGQIALQFVPTGVRGVASPVCDSGQRVPYEKGSYAGVFEFHGEEGYAKVTASSIPFSIHPWIDLGCGGPVGGELWGPSLPGARLTVWSRLGATSVFLKAVQNRPGARVHLDAAIEEERGGIQIEREVRQTSPGTVFEFAPDLRFAAFRPSAPFSGTGTFRDGAAQVNRWTGNLALDFPGRSNVSLAGARFRANLVPARLIKPEIEPETTRGFSLHPWLSTKPSPLASATFLPLVPS
jgi:hypothetical protein